MAVEGVPASGSMDEKVNVDWQSGGLVNPELSQRATMT